jgi:aerobic carbon-monoxide dehydrogenase medium subunit
MIHDFEYHAPREVEEALSLLDALRGAAKIIAGGQSLLILMRQGLVAPEHIIDIKRLTELDYLRLSEDGALHIGALSTHRSLELSPVVRNGFRALADMEQNLASVETRNWGTIGGNLCHADPAADPTPLLIALAAVAKVKSVRGERLVAVEDFSRDFYETVLDEDELLVKIEVPAPAPHTATVYRKASHLTGDHALASVAASLTLDEAGVCTQARLVLGAVNTVPTRARRAEEMLRGHASSPDLLAAAAEAAAAAAEPVSDMHASEEYRRELIRVLAREVTSAAYAQARSGAREGAGRP